MLSHDFALKGDQTYPQVTLDADNLPYVVWQDTRSFVDNTITTDSNIFMQKYDANGVPQWPVGDTAVTIGGTEYTSAYSVMDVRVDTFADSATAGGGTGTHYSGRPRVGAPTGMLSGDSTKRMPIVWEDNRNNGTNVSVTSCGRSNSSNLVNVCSQSYDISDYGIAQATDWDVFFFANNASTPTIGVNAGMYEWDATQIVEEDTAQSWTACSPACLTDPVEQNITFATPPSDTHGIVTMRRLGVKFDRTGGSFDLSYDNTGVNSRLGTGDIVPERSILLSLVIPFLPPLIYYWVKRRQRRTEKLLYG